VFVLVFASVILVSEFVVAAVVADAVSVEIPNVVVC